MKEIENYIQNQPELYRRVFHQLRILILNSSPKIIEKYSYQCPFYYYKKPLIYIYTSKKKPNKVLLGFCQGAQLSNVQHLLTATDRKQIRLIEIDVKSKPKLNLIKEIVNEAILLQDVIYK